MPILLLINFVFSQQDSFVHNLKTTERESTKEQHNFYFSRTFWHLITGNEVFINFAARIAPDCYDKPQGYTKLPEDMVTLTFDTIGNTDIIQREKQILEPLKKNGISHFLHSLEKFADKGIVDELRILFDLALGTSLATEMPTELCILLPKELLRIMNEEDYSIDSTEARIVFAAVCAKMLPPLHKVVTSAVSKLKIDGFFHSYWSLGLTLGSFIDALESTNWSKTHIATGLGFGDYSRLVIEPLLDTEKGRLSLDILNSLSDFLIEKNTFSSASLVSRILDIKKLRTKPITSD